MVNKRVRNAVHGCNLKNNKMITVCFQGKPFNITVIWAYAPTSNAEEAKAETPVLWPPHVKSWLTGKDSDAGRDWGQEEKGTTEDEMAGWHHQLDGHEFEWTPGVGDGQGGLAYCSSWGHKESDTTEQLNWTELNWSWLAHEVTCQDYML